MATEIGKLAEMLHEAGTGETPLQVQVHSLGKRLAIVAAVAVAIFFLLGLVRGQGLAATTLSSVALAVAAIPEGLPAVVTVTLAVGVHQMANGGRSSSGSRRSRSLGATTVICSDKTGTLTLNQMTARTVVAGGEIYDVSGSGYGADGRITGCIDDAARGIALRDVLTTGALCNDSTVDGGVLVGRGALVTLAAKGGVDPHALRHAWPRVAELPSCPPTPPARS